MVWNNFFNCYEQQDIFAASKVWIMNYILITFWELTQVVQLWKILKLMQCVAYIVDVKYPLNQCFVTFFQSYPSFEK